MITIRRAELDDIPQMRAVGSASWRATYSGIFPDAFIANVLDQWWSEDGFRRSIPDARVCHLVAEQDERIVGTLLGSISPDEEGQVHLFRLYLHPDYFGQGIGRQLWQAYLQRLAPDIRRVGLEVELQNTRAIQFYTHLGFQEIGRNETQVFGTVMNTIRMSLNLQGDKTRDISGR